ncbi:SAM-dependent methyltransferase [Streptomyces globosus]|uniref:SAM-dependent methyltransferase n=1 Tax=Streptomyces globosus TaxID=68209 RepID=A0A344U1W8_9ACTN|nr:SAM-dependent methyltransferase [Streptomyces globosus]
MDGVDRGRVARWALTRAFGRPSGLLGRLGGRLMARVNAATERHAVLLAAPTERDTVLVVGPGPGVGLEAAARRSAHVIGIDPSPAMLAAARRRCAGALARGRLRLTAGTADRTGLPDGSVDIVMAVNNVQLWPDVPAALAELRRVLRPGGRILLCTHLKWLPGGSATLADGVRAAGFESVRTWTWEPPGRMASTAALLSAARPVRFLPGSGPGSDPGAA